MSFSRQQAVSGIDQGAYTPTEIETSLDVSLLPEKCPNCLFAEVEVEPEDQRQRYLEFEYGDRWVRAKFFEDNGLPLTFDVTPRIHTDGLFKARSEDIVMPSIRLFARDGYRGGMIEYQTPLEDAGQWYSRAVEQIYGVGLSNESGDLRVRMVPGGENLTQKHVINGNTAYSLFTARCDVQMWRSAPTWNSNDVKIPVESADIVLPSQPMSLVVSGQEFFETTFDLSAIDPVLSGDIYILPSFSMGYTNVECQALDGNVALARTPWVLEVREESSSSGTSSSVSESSSNEVDRYAYIGKVGF